MVSKKAPRVRATREERRKNTEGKRASKKAYSDENARLPAKGFPTPPPALLEIISHFLKDHGYGDADAAMKAESQRRENVKGRTEPVSWEGAAGGKPNLIKLYEEWLEDRAIDKEIEKNQTKKQGSGSSGENPERALRATRNLKDSDYGSSDSSSESSSDSGSDVAMADVDGPATSSPSSPSPSSSSSSSSSSSAPGRKRAERAPVKTLKRKAASSSESSSSESDSGSSDSSSSSEDEAPPAKRVKRARSSSSSSSESESDSSSSSSSSSEEDAPPSRRIKRASSNSSSSSSSSSNSSSSSSASGSNTRLSKNIKPLQPSKITKTVGRSQSSGSDSSESNSSSDSSDSESASDTKKTTKRPTSASALEAPKAAESASDSSSNSSSSDSDSDSGAEKIKSLNATAMDRKASTDSSHTLGNTSPDPTTNSKGAKPHNPNPASENTTSNGSAENGNMSGKKLNEPFSRISKDIRVDPRFSSNKYVSYDYADRAHRDLSITKGKGFTKEKNKKKRGSYKGGYIDTQARGIKFDD